MSHIEMLTQLRDLYHGEALFRPSSINRLLACPGSVQLIGRSPREKTASSFAQEGTAAHIVAAQALTGVRQPDEWTDRMVQLDDKGANGWFVTKEMAESVQFYLSEIADRWTPSTEQHTEYSLSLAALDPTDPIMAENRGTADSVLIDRKNGKLTIGDLKYGKGVEVAGDTPQLKDYALMGLIAFGQDGTRWEEVETVIVQPRLFDESKRVKSVVHKPNDLLTDFLGQLVEKMYKALEPEPPLQAGTHCRWCRAAASCPALQQEALHMSRDTFDTLPVKTGTSLLSEMPVVVQASFGEQKANTEKVVFLPAAEGLSAADLATVLDREVFWDTWIKAVKERAVSLLERGITVPGYKLVQRTGNRRWKDPVNTTVDSLRAMGISMSDIFKEPELISPAQMEKILPRSHKDALAKLVERPLGEPTLVHESDKRPAVTPSGLTSLVA